MLELSNEAIIHSVKKTEETGNENIRLGVTGGGCAGYEYIIEWAHAIDSDDYVFDYGKFKVVIDKVSYQYFQNATLDYVTEGINSFFKIINPDEKASCGCGVSVSF